MNLPQRLPAAARDQVRRRWPNGRLLRVGRAWAIVGRSNLGSDSGTDDGLPAGWYSVLVADVDYPDGPGRPRLWWTPVAWGLRRRRDAGAAALATEQEVRS